MLINMIIVHVMEMAVMQIVDVTLMAYCRMPAIGTVPVRMARMMILVASGHLDFPFFLAGCRRYWHFSVGAFFGFDHGEGLRISSGPLGFGI
jgi:hypothetical protein